MQSPIGQTSRCERQSMPTMSPICRKAWPHRCSLNGGTADAPALQPTTLDATHSATMATHATLGIVAAVVSQAEVVPGDVGSAAWRSGVTKPSFARDWSSAMAEGCSTKRVYSMRAHRVGLPAEMLGSPTCSWDPTSRQCLSAAATLRETPTPGGTLGSAGSHFELATTS